MLLIMLNLSLHLLQLLRKYIDSKIKWETEKERKCYSLKTVVYFPNDIEIGIDLLITSKVYIEAWNYRLFSIYCNTVFKKTV